MKQSESRNINYSKEDEEMIEYAFMMNFPIAHYAQLQKLEKEKDAHETMHNRNQMIKERSLGLTGLSKFLKIYMPVRTEEQLKSKYNKKLKGDSSKKNSSLPVEQRFTLLSDYEKVKDAEEEIRKAWETSCGLATENQGSIFFTSMTKSDCTTFSFAKLGKKKLPEDADFSFGDSFCAEKRLKTQTSMLKPQISEFSSTKCSTQDLDKKTNHNKEEAPSGYNFSHSFVEGRVTSAVYNTFNEDQGGYNRDSVDLDLGFWNSICGSEVALDQEDHCTCLQENCYHNSLNL